MQVQGVSKFCMHQYSFVYSLLRKGAVECKIRLDSMW
jgi:hypothetical protein